MRVAWIADEHAPPGGAELTQAEFKAVAPDGVRVLPAFDGKGALDQADVVVVHNCVGFDRRIIPLLEGKPVVKYIHDQWPHGDPVLRGWLLHNAHLIFTGRLHHDCFPWTTPATGKGLTRAMIPPAVNLDAYRQAARDRTAPRLDAACWIGHHTNPGKGIDLAVEWAHRNNTRLDVYGDGPLAPQPTSLVRPLPAIHPDLVANTLASYQTHVLLPTAIEPFGRVTVEAWAAGCEVVYNRMVGASEYLEGNQAALETAGQDFWDTVTDAASC